MYQKITLCLFSVLFFSSATHAQTWPIEMGLSQDSTMLTIGGSPASDLYNDSIVRSLYLTFPQTNYWSLMQTNYTTKTDIPATFVVDGVTYDSVGVRFKGQTSYQQSNSSPKKSFNITTDFIHDNQDVMGYETLNLNNAFNDASFLREVFYTHQIRKHIPTAKSNFVKLYLNNENWGLYPNVQQLNKDFLKEWFLTNNGTNWRADKPSGSSGGGGPQWGDGTAALNYLGDDTTDYQEYYTLKSSDDNTPWDLLMTACHVLDTVSDEHMEEVLNNYFDVDRALWFLASEIAFADDDGYAFKGKMDYYVYHEVETGRITPLEYDGNSAMKMNNVTWSPFYHATNANYVLLYKLLNNPTLRQRYLAHMRTIIEDEFNTTECNATLDWYQAMIDTMVYNDPKKATTYDEFISEVTVLKNFIQTRRNNLLANSEVSESGPSISDAAHYVDDLQWGKPAEAQAVNVTANVTSTNGINNVQLYYSTDIVGKFNKTMMYDDGMHDDGNSGDGLFGANIPGQPGGTWVRWYVEASSANTGKTVSYVPAGAEHNVFVYQVKVGSTTNVAPVGEVNSIELFPNPANEMVYVKTTSDVNDLVVIMNAVGQTIFKLQSANASLKINTSVLPVGIYFVRFGSVVKKLVVTH